MLRARNASLEEISVAVGFAFEDQTIRARKGESLLAALVASGELRLRVTEEGEFRGPFCGTGDCQECLREVDCRCQRRACMTTVETGMTVRRRTNRVAIEPERHDLAPGRWQAEPARTPQIAVIGGGPTGMASAAMAAHSGADDLLIDERTQPGGQYFKHPLAARGLRPADIDDRCPGLLATSSLLGMMTADPRLAAAGVGNLAFLARRGIPPVYVRRIDRIESGGQGDRLQLQVVAGCLSGSDTAHRECQADAVCLGYGFLQSWRGWPSRLNSGLDPALTEMPCRKMPSYLPLRFKLPELRLHQAWIVGNSPCGFDRKAQALFGSP